MIGDIDDGFVILGSFSGESDHKIKFDEIPTGGEGGLRSGEELLVGNILVDGAAQSFGAGLRRDGQVANSAGEDEAAK